MSFSACFGLKFDSNLQLKLSTSDFGMFTESFISCSVRHQNHTQIIDIYSGSLS